MTNNQTPKFLRYRDEESEGFYCPDPITCQFPLCNCGPEHQTIEEREIAAREECTKRGIDPDEICADGGVTVWMAVDQEKQRR